MIPPAGSSFWHALGDQEIVDAMVRAGRDVERLADLVHRGLVRHHEGEHERRHPGRARRLSEAVYASLSQRSMRVLSGPARGADTIRPRKKRR